MQVNNLAEIVQKMIWHPKSPFWSESMYIVLKLAISESIKILGKTEYSNSSNRNEFPFYKWDRKIIESSNQQYLFHRNNNISILSKVRHPKKQPIENIRRLKGDALRKNLFSNLSMEERHKQRREGAGEFLDDTMWKK